MSRHGTSARPAAESARRHVMCAPNSRLRQRCQSRSPIEATIAKSTTAIARLTTSSTGNHRSKSVESELVAASMKSEMHARTSEAMKSPRSQDDMLYSPAALRTSSGMATGSQLLSTVQSPESWLVTCMGLGSLPVSSEKRISA